MREIFLFYIYLCSGEKIKFIHEESQYRVVVAVRIMDGQGKCKWLIFESAIESILLKCVRFYYGGVWKLNWYAIFATAQIRREKNLCM